MNFLFCFLLCSSLNLECSGVMHSYNLLLCLDNNVFISTLFLFRSRALPLNVCILLYRRAVLWELRI